MRTVKDIDLNRIKYVHIHLQGLEVRFTYTGYDLGEGVWREQDGWGWVHLAKFMRHPTEDFESSWVRVAELERVEKVEVASIAEFLSSKR